MPLSADFNPRPPCGGRLLTVEEEDQVKGFQSTPPVRGATDFCAEGPGCPHISIHAPRAGGDPKRRYENSPFPYFNPRPPCGGRPCGSHDLRRAQHISIHAPRAGGDAMLSHGKWLPWLFQSTPPVRGATVQQDRPRHVP